ncbi:uncharacterized protein SCHCODRAFT_02525281 [Schizophyllum commune H4-8]|uniref:CST complex subunit STN1 n=1 Tax=Schizophyllum commune (strain H4-8 / FGSC 9210) TaxID=578458 RepID=D8PWF9_SCHCM
MQPSTPYTHAEIFKWTLTADAVAPCFVEDVFKLEENEKHTSDFFWLGSVPCRTVKLVGMLVGVQTYEKRIVYSVDDGTAVIDCVDRHPTLQTPSSSSFFFGKMPLPIADVGASVTVIGNVLPKKERQISISSIERCKHANAEPLHWLAVRQLHRVSYTSSTPFVIPEQTTPTTPADEVPSRPQTPVSLASSSAPPSPTKSVASSVAASPSKLKTLMKLRHPSRLHTRDLTQNTFRVYLKHFMDNAPPPATEDNTPPTASPFSTPKKRIRRADSDVTPRAARLMPIENTPRGCRPATTTCSNEPAAIGFTLSYLRRVPELRDLAKRVVKAEAKRRARAAKAKERNNREAEPAKPLGAGASKPRKSISDEPISRRMKRLFQWALTALLNDGYIVLWDGPPRPCSSAEPLPDTSCLWKTSASANATTSTVDTTASSLVSASESQGLDEDELSDPDEREESYVPLEPTVLAKAVENAVSSLISRKRRHKASADSHALSTSKESVIALMQRDDRWRYLHSWQVEQTLEHLVDQDVLCERSNGRYSIRRTSR